MELKIGMKFSIKYFEGLYEMLDINESENTLTVEIHKASKHNFSEIWDLKYTIQCFEQGFYILKQPKL